MRNANSESNCHAHTHTQCYAYSHSYGDSQTNAHCQAERNPEDTAHPAAAPITCFDDKQNALLDPQP